MVAAARTCRVQVCSTCQLVLLVVVEGSEAGVADIVAAIEVDTGSGFASEAAAAAAVVDMVVGICCLMTWMQMGWPVLAVAAAESAAAEVAAEVAGSEASTSGMCWNVGAKAAVGVISETVIVLLYSGSKYERDKGLKGRYFVIDMHRDCPVRLTLEELSEGMDYNCYSLEAERSYNSAAFAEEEPAGS